MKLDTSPVTQHIFKDHSFYMKRDDQLHQHFSGNKARKFMQLLEENQPGIDTLIGYGSIQANSLYSLAALCKIKGWRFEFYVHRIPKWLKANPTGNYRGALDLGANIIESKNQFQEAVHPAEYIQTIRKPSTNCLVMPEGGRSYLSEYGIKSLAHEIINWTRYKNGHQFVVALPSGTGTTSLYLHKYLKQHNIPVLTCACVGGKNYLFKQWLDLDEVEFPEILESDYKHHFGQLYESEYRLWHDLKRETHVEFDLLYDPYMWQCLLPWMDKNPDKTVLYLHQGGLLGNESMQPRYQRKFSSLN